MFSTLYFRRCFGQGVLLVTLIAGWPLSGAAQIGPSRGTESTMAALGIKDGELAAAVHRAVRGAARRLEQPSCAAVLGRFANRAGQSLSDVLEALGLTPSESFSRIIFRDGRDTATCQGSAVAAFTGPGSRVVFVCGPRFALIGRARAEEVVIHEMLHTLGLGEQPPTPGQIDGVVASHCPS
jgi:hypothetical protein